MTIAELLVAINGDTSGLDTALKKATNNTKTSMDKIVDMVGLGAAAWKGIGLAVGGIKFNAMMESAQTSFGIMLGSAEDAKQKLKDLKYLADHSPLTFAGVTAATTTLLQFGIAGDKVVPTVRMLGDVAGGNEERMQRLALAFAQVSAAGKIQGQDLLQMINAGYNPLMTISKKTGESMSELRKRMEAGGISAQEVAEAFQTVTSKGGQFYGMLEANAKTLTGSFSTLTDASQTFLGRTMDAFSGPVKSAIQATTVVLNIIPGQLSAIALTAGTVATAAMAIGTKFQLALGPIGLASAAIGALVAAIMVGVNEMDKLAKANVERMSNNFTAIAEHAKMTSEQTSVLFEKIEKIEYAASRWKGSAAETAGYIEKLSKESGITKENVANILLNSDRTSDSIKSGAEQYLKSNGLAIIGKQTAEQKLAVETANAKKKEEEASANAGILAKEKERLSTNETLKQQTITQSGYYVELVDAARRWNQEIGYIGKSNEEVISQAEEQATYVNNIVEAYKAANGYIAQNASDVEDALAIEATGQKLVLGYMSQALAKQATANDLEKAYQENLNKVADTWKGISDGFAYANTQFSALSKAARSFGQDALAKALSSMAEMAKDGQNLVTALGSGDYIAAAVSGVALLGDVWGQLWGSQSEAQKKASDEARQAEAERVAAVKKLNDEYQAKFDSDLVRLQKERDERVAYARSIGADVLNIERYYAGEIAKVRTKSTGTAVEAAKVAAETAKIQAVFDNRLRELVRAQYAGNSQDIIDYFVSRYKETAATLVKSTPNSEFAKAVAALDAEFRDAISDMTVALNLFEDRYSQVFDGLSSTLSDALKKGMSQTDFKTSILDMLRNMAIDAAILAGGFQEQFKNIGVMVAEALKDGFQAGEIDAISAKIDELYTSATAAIDPLNKLFASKGLSVPGYATGTNYAPGGLAWVGEDGAELMNIPRGAQIIPHKASMALAQSVSTVSTKGDNNFYIQSPSPLDPLQTTRLIRETQESLAFAGAF